MAKGFQRRRGGAHRRSWGSAVCGQRQWDATLRPTVSVPCLAVGSGVGGAHGSIHTPWLPSITQGTCLQMAPWEPVGPKFVLVIVHFIKMKFQAEGHYIKQIHVQQRCSIKGGGGLGSVYWGPSCLPTHKYQAPTSSLKIKRESLALGRP